MPNAVALIPARSGSERVKDKNVRPLAGHPLLAYAVATARQSGIFDRVVCSTDSGKIGEVAQRYGADVPFLRPQELATSTSPDIEWLRYTLDRLGEHYDLFAIVRATNPFRGPDVLQRGLQQLLATPEADSIRAVSGLLQRVLNAAETKGVAPSAALAREVLEGLAPKAPRRQTATRTSGVVAPVVGARSREKVVWDWPDVGDRIVEEWR